MSFVQVTLDIDPEIAAGIQNGIYNLSKAVVRKNSSGQIYKHVSIVENAIKDNKNSLLDMISKHKGATIAVSLSVATFAAGGFAYLYNKAKKKKEKTKEISDRFSILLNEYIVAANEQRLNNDILDELLNFLHEIDTVCDKKTLSLSISPNQVEKLVQMIHDYTIKLADANNYDHIEYRGESNDYIFDLKKYLETQKEILVAA